MLTIESMGIDTPHDPDEVILRPTGIPHFLLACFSTPFIGLGSNNEHYQGQPGDCLLRTPNQPDYFASVAGATKGFRGDWLHLRGDVVWQLIEKYEAPTNQYVATGHPHLFTDLVREAIREQRDKPPFWEDSIEQLVERMILRLSRSACTQADLAGFTAAERHHLSHFQALRDRLYAEFDRTWSVERMAREAGLSISRFCVLYRRFFNCPPGEDLLNARLDFAKKQLASTSDSIGAIAEACGFASIYHFSRIFRKRVGCAPSNYVRGAGL